MKDTMVKHLNKRKEEFYTEEIADRKKAVESKLKLLHGSFFGKQIVKFEIGSVADVWVPYCYLEYDFHVERNIMFKKKGLVKEGKVAVVFDANEMHPFQYDVYESGSLQLKKGKIKIEEKKVVAASGSVSDMKKKSEEYIQYKIMRKFYGRNGELTLRKETLFYRPAVELEIIYKGRHSNMRYAYLDQFAIENEHVLGLKYRVENNF